MSREAPTFYTKTDLPRVVITGLGGIWADGNPPKGGSGIIVGRKEFEDRVRNGRTLVGRTPEHALALYSKLDDKVSRVGAYFPFQFNPFDLSTKEADIARDKTSLTDNIASPYNLLPEELKKLVPPLREPRASFSAKLASVAALDAIKDANLSRESLDPGQTGVAISSSTGPAELIEAALQEILKDNTVRDKKEERERLIAMTSVINNGLPDEVIRIVAKVLGIYGYPINNVAACASGLSNIIAAADAIRLGHATKMVAGGVEVTNSRIWAEVFKTAGVMATGSNNKPQESSRPADIGRTGLVPSEGAAVVVLELLDDVIKDGREDRILAEYISGQSALDVEGVTPDREHKATSHALRTTLEQTGLVFSGTDGTFPHMTGTRVGDQTEGETIYELNPHTVVYPGKSVTGHGFARAGVDRVGEAIVSFADQKVPKPVNLETPGTLLTKNKEQYIETHPLEDLIWSFEKNQTGHKPIKTAALHAIGMQGVNSVALLAKYDPHSQF